MNRSRITGDLTASGLLYADIANDRVGIGSTIPGNKLSLPDSAKIGLGNAEDLTLYHNGSNSVINNTTGSLLFQIGGAEKLRIKSNGFVGIGTDNPTSKLHLANTNSTVWPFTSAVTDTYGYTPYPHELIIDNDVRGTTGSFAGIYFNAGADSDGSKVSTARIAAIDTGDYKADLVFATRGYASGGGGADDHKEHLRITSDGKVGISEDDPQAQLHINSGANSAIMFGNTTNGYKIRANVTSSHDYGLLIEDEDGVDLYRAVASTGSTNANTHTFFTSGNERLRIASNGRVLIGDGTTYSASGDLHIVGDTNSNGPELYLQVNNNNTTDNIGALWFGNNVDKSLVKLAGHTHTANNTADFTVSTSAAGTLGERLRITSAGDVCINRTGAIEDAKLSIQCDATQAAIGIQCNHTNTDTDLITAFNSGGKNIVNITAETDNSPYLKFEILSGNTAIERFRVNHLGNVAIGGGTASNRLEIINDHQGMVADSAQPNATLLIKHGTSGSNRRWIGLGASTSMAWLQSSSPGNTGLAAPFEINPGGGDVTLGNDKLKVANSGGIVWIGSFTQYGNSGFNASNGGTVITSSGENTLKLIDSTAQAQDVGARILLGGNYRSSGDASPFVELKAYKENGTDNNYDYGFIIGTTQNGGSLSNSLVVKSSGDTDIYGSQVHLYNNANTSNTYFVAQNTAAGNAGIRMKNNQGDFAIIANDNLRFYDMENSAEHMTLTPTGRIGIGNNSPEAALHPRANTNTGTDTAFMVGTGNRFFKLLELSGQDNFGQCYMQFYDNSLREILTLENSYAGLVSMGMEIAFRGHGGGKTGDIRVYNTAVNSTQSKMDMSANGGVGIEIDHNGHVGKPNTPSFAAYRAQSSWSVSSGAEMVFNATRHNVGSHYSTSTGRFTAPRAGSYLFTFFIIYQGNHNSAYIRMYKNGSRQYGSDIHFTHADNNGHWDNIAYSQIFYLAANDYVSMYNGNHTGGYHGNHWMQFCGYLLG